MISTPQNFVLPGITPTLLDNFESGWAIPGISTGTCAVSSFLTEGTASLKHMSQNGVESYIQKSVNLDMSSYSLFYVDLYVEVPNGTSFPGATIAIYFLTSGSGSDYQVATNIAVHPGMNRIVLHRSQFTQAGTALSNWSQAIQYLRFRLFSLAGVTWSVYWDNFRASAGLVQQPKFVFRNDDLWDTVKSWFCPTLESYDQYLPSTRKMRASLYCATSLLGTANHLVPSDVDAINAAGHDISSHTTLHVNMGTNNYTTQQTLDDVGPNLTYVSQWNTRGLNSHLHFAYPFGGFNEAVFTGLRQLGVLTASTTLTPTWQASDMDNYLTEVVFYADSTSTFAQFKAWFDLILSTGQTGIFVTHRHVAAGATGPELNQPLMLQIIQYVFGWHKIGAIDVVTEPQRYAAMKLKT